jgi:hypothetical protein
MIKVLLLWVLPLALTVYAVVDCAIDDEVERTSIPKLFWIILIVLVPYVGPLSWLILAKFAKPKSRPARPSGWGARPAPVAPDDNPRFLREWAEEQARKERERRREQRDDGDDPAGPPSSSH